VTSPQSRPRFILMPCGASVPLADAISLRRAVFPPIAPTLSRWSGAGRLRLFLPQRPTTIPAAVPTGNKGLWLRLVGQPAHSKYTRIRAALRAQGEKPSGGAIL